MSKSFQSRNHQTNDIHGQETRKFVRTTVLVILVTTILRTMGDAVESIAFPWNMLETTTRLTTVAGVSIALMVPWIFLPPFIGKFIDRIRNKSLATSLASIIQSFCIILIIVLFLMARDANTIPVFMILALYMLMAIVSSMDIFHDYFTFIMIPTITKKKEDSQLQKYNTMLKLSSGITSILIYPIIGWSFTIIGTYILGTDVFFLLTAASFLLFHHFVQFSSNDSESNRQLDESSESRELVNSNHAIQDTEWKHLLLNTPLLASLLSLPTFNFALGAVTVIIIGYLNKHARDPPFLHGIILSVETIGFLISGSLLITVFRRIPVEKTIILAMIGQSTILIGLGIMLLDNPSIQMTNIPFLGILMLWIIYSSSSLLLNVSGSSFVQKHGTANQLGTVRGLFDILATTPILLSKLVVAFLIDNAVISIPLMSMLLGLLAMMSAGVFYIIVKMMEDRRSTELNNPLKRVE